MRVLLVVAFVLSACGGGPATEAYTSQECELALTFRQVCDDLSDYCADPDGCTEEEIDAAVRMFYAGYELEDQEGSPMPQERVVAIGQNAQALEARLRALTDADDRFKTIITARDALGVAPGQRNWMCRGRTNASGYERRSTFEPSLDQCTFPTGITH